MTLETFPDLQQGSPEWFQARCGVPTTSCFSDILAKGQGITRARYMRRLAGEIVTGAPEETYRSPEMERGNAMEDEARKAYSLVTGHDPLRIGFVKNIITGVGYSPDSFISYDGLLEIKTAKPSVLIEFMQRDDFPSTHVAQCQGGLYVTGRKWLDLCQYWPGLPLVIHRTQRDEKYIENLDREVKLFKKELNEMVEKIKKYGGRSL